MAPEVDGVELEAVEVEDMDNACPVGCELLVRAPSDDNCRLTEDIIRHAPACGG